MCRAYSAPSVEVWGPSACESVSQLTVAREREFWQEGICQPINRILRIKVSCCLPM
jgi:hypothetical protein